MLAKSRLYKVESLTNADSISVNKTSGFNELVIKLLSDVVRMGQFECGGDLYCNLVVDCVERLSPGYIFEGIAFSLRVRESKKY